MNWSESNKSNGYFIVKKGKSFQDDKNEVLKVVEDKTDWTQKLNWIAAEGTKKGFKKAKKVSREIVLQQNGKIIIKKHGKPSQVLDVVNERKVEVGKTITLHI